MTIHALFPTLLLAEEDPNHPDRKPVYMRSLLKYLDSDGYSDESTGHVTIHLDPIFDPICQMATAMARQYCEVMRIDPSIFDFYIVKSWFNIIQNRATPFHSHADAHLSFSYYVNVPSDFAQPIRFHAHPYRYEPFPGFVKFNDPEEWNIFNSSSWQFPASEGTMYLWPSAMCHDTIGNSADRDPGIFLEGDAERNRITFAGDIILTYKEKAAKAMGLQPRRNWKSFSGL